jgi:hypothetical protein
LGDSCAAGVGELSTAGAAVGNGVGDGITSGVEVTVGSATTGVWTCGVGLAVISILDGGDSVSGTRVDGVISTFFSSRGGGVEAAGSAALVDCGVGVGSAILT